MRSWKHLVALCIVCWGANVWSQRIDSFNPSAYDAREMLDGHQNEHFGVTDLTRGIRFDGHLSAIGQAPSDPNRLYVGTQKGRVHVSRDGGRSWEETSIHTHKRPFVGALRGFEVPENTLTRPLGIRPLSMSRLHQFYLPSRLFDSTSTTGEDANAPGQLFWKESTELTRVEVGFDLVRNRDPVQDLTRSTYVGQTIPDSLAFSNSDGGGRATWRLVYAPAHPGSPIKYDVVVAGG